MDTLLKFLIGVVVVVVVALLGLLGFLAVDQVWVDAQEAGGVVVGRTHQDSFVIFVFIGKILTPIHHPENWALCVEVEGRGTGCVSVSEEAYNTVADGTKVTVTYILGRVSGELVVQDIHLLST